MKTKQLFWIFTLTLLVLSCTKETLRQEDALLPSDASSQPSQPAEPQKPPRPQMTLSAYSQGAEDEASEERSAADAQAEEETKLSFIDNSTPTGGKFSVAWDETISNESIRVLGKDASGEYIEDDNVVLTGSNRISAHKAEFTGDAPSEDSKTFDIIYPSDYESIEDFKTRGFGQTQASSGSTAHLTYNALFKDMEQCSYVNFSERWAREQGLDFYCTSCLKLTLQLPDERDVEAVDGVKEISIISSDANNFYRTNDSGSKTNILSISFADWNTEGGNVDKVAKDDYTQRTITAFFMLAGFDQSISTENTYTIKFVDASGYTWTKTGWAPKTTTVMTQGNMYTLTINKSSFAKGTQYVDSGTGTVADPYIIRTPAQMDAARNLLVDVTSVSGEFSSAEEAKIPHFKLGNDIDMSAYAEWTPWIAAYPSMGSLPSITNKYFSFDGDDKTISNLDVSKVAGTSYSGLFGMVTYELKNVTFKNFYNNDTSSGYPFGLVASWIGGQQTAIPIVEISDVHIVDSEIVNSSSYRMEVGAFSARCAHTTMTDCSVERCKITQASTNVVDDGYDATNTQFGTMASGGFFGRTYGVIDMQNCESEDNVISSNKYYSGGIIGIMGGPDNSMNNLSLGYMKGCSCNSSISSTNYYAGGLVGAIAHDTNDTGDGVPFRLMNTTPCSFTGSVTATRFVGGIVGGRIKNRESSMTLTLSNCVVDGADLTATSVPLQSASGGIIGIARAETGPLTISNCVVDATILGDQLLGGIMGQVESGNSITISDCTTAGSISNVTLASAYQYSLFAGILAGTTVETHIDHCTSTMDITSAGTSCGGIVAQADPCSDSLVVDRCRYQGNLKSSQNYIAGIVAYIKQRPTRIWRCCSSGDLQIYDKHNYAGGIVGLLKTEKADGSGYWDAKIIDCYSTMDITNQNGGFSGGIVGDIGRNVSVKYCLYYGDHLTGAGGHFKSNFGSGGIIGRACDHNVDSKSTSGGFGNVVYKCISGYLSFTSYDGAKRNTSGSYSNGAIIGYTNIYNDLSQCTRLKSGTGGVMRTFQFYSDPSLDTAIMTDENSYQRSHYGPSTALTGFPQGGTYDACYIGAYNSSNTKFTAGVMTSYHFDTERKGTWNFSNSESCMPGLIWESEQ